MRNALVLVLVGLVAASSVSIGGCGDASSSTGIQRRGGGNQNTPSGEHDPDATDDENTPDPGNPEATTPPAAPATPGTAAGELAVKVDNVTPSVDLGDKIELNVTVEPKSGFTGAAELTATGLPTGVTAVFTPATVTVGTAPIPAKVAITVPVTTTVSAVGASSPLVVTATSGAIKATANVSFKVAPKVKLTIPMNIDALRTTGTKFLDQWGTAFGAVPQNLSTQAGNPIVFTVFNADSVQHVVHGNNGFTHGSTTVGQEVKPNAFELQNGVTRTRTLAPGANVNGYPHEGAAGASAGFQIRIVAAP